MIAIKTNMRVIPRRCKECKYSEVRPYTDREIEKLKRRRLSPRVCTLLERNIPMTKVGVDTYRLKKHPKCPLFIYEEPSDEAVETIETTEEIDVVEDNESEENGDKNDKCED